MLDTTHTADTGTGQARPAGPAAVRFSLICLFAGAFAVGTDGFMIAGLLPQIAREFTTTTAVAAQLVTVFAVTYALGAPVLASLLASVGQRTLLMIALGALGAMNALAASAPSLAVLFAARIAAALAACLYTPTATVIAGGLATGERRGRALSVIAAGLATSIATGVPLGALVGERFGWRATFTGIAILSAIAATAVRLVLPRAVSGPPPAALRARLAAVRTPGVYRVLATTLLGVLAGYLGYTYAAPVSAAAGARGELAVILACFGAGATCGSILSGAAADRFGQPLVLRAGLTLQASALAALAALDLTGPRLGVIPAAVAFTLLGVGSFNYGAPQQRRLMELAPGSATTLVSLNSSAIYIGIGLSAAVGSLTLQASPAANCLAGAAIAVATALIARQRQTRERQQPCPAAQDPITTARSASSSPAQPASSGYVCCPC
jgi:MFS transporter, DHA1 family, inner membrane transport protein